MISQNKIQHTNSPWIFNSLNRLQYEELFEINLQMQDVLDRELYSFLSEIFNLLSEEKSSVINTIDSLIASAETNITSMKQCLNCHQKNIENRKQTCPKCKIWLLTLAEIQKEKLINIEDETVDRSMMPLIFKPCNFNQESSVMPSSRISLTQRPADHRVNIPEIYIPDLINLNPNSIANVKKVLLHIEKISGIKDGTRKWIAVTCDGVPYHHTTKINKKFPWLILIPEQLHEKMNMLKAYVKLNWEIDLKQFAICQGYQTDNQLSFFKKCVDHHKSWDSICNIYHQAIAMELMWPYIKTHSDPSIEGYIAWAKEQQDLLYQIKYEQTFVYLQAIINYQKAIRTNDPLLKKAAKRIFSPIWFARRHPIYRLIEIADEIQLIQLYPEIRETLIPPVLQYHHWKIAARNSNTRTSCQSLGNDELSDQLKNFTYLTKQVRKNYIVEIFINQNSSSFFRKIPITKQEADMQDIKENMTKVEISLKIETLLEQLSETARKKYSGFRLKKRDELLSILQEIKYLFNSNNEFDNQDSLENS
ncbi:9857_t:CDS:2 [Diversispora eburnea]|uniref:9857_t:CDS:1 n=1 Tax=Diversispora eburnea TaxID=1213867 RepID=A0A9N9GKF4_9GLOM|nr:9857_t:CDS:2 [Diversispora eburnea]